MNRKGFLMLFISITAFTVLIAGGLFYWYGYRPSMVRETCSKFAEKAAEKDLFVYEIIYRHCLRTNGIEYNELGTDIPVGSR
jgi:hypothetical protein